jgi:hypothetical protein
VLPRLLRIIFLVLSLVIPVAVAAADNSAIVGVWKGKMDSLPMLTPTVEEETES